jgi:hypothetical protein
MAEKSLGECSIIDDCHKLFGIITEGDIHRLIGKNENLYGIAASKLPIEIQKNSIQQYPWRYTMHNGIW